MQIKKVKPQSGVSAQAGLTGRATKSLPKITLIQVQSMKQPSFWLLAAPRVCRPAEGDQKVQTFHRCCKCLFKNNRTRTHWLRSRKLMCIPASESLPSPRVLQHHCAAAPFCTTTNEAQHGNVMGNCVRRLPSMQRSRISLEAAPRLLPSGFSMNEPGCC